VQHPECRPRKKDPCTEWRPRGDPERYIQVADGPAFGDAIVVRTPSERPIFVEGELPDRDLVSLVLYARSNPRLHAADGISGMQISGRYPIMSIAPLKDRSIWVRFSGDGARFRRSLRKLEAGPPHNRS
jgi:hypothetical protein